MHLKEVCKELNAKDCIKFPYYCNIITLRISLDFHTFDRITEWVRDHNVSSASVSLLKQSLPRPFIFSHLHHVKSFVICVVVQVVADKVATFKWDKNFIKLNNYIQSPIAEIKTFVL